MGARGVLYGVGVGPGDPELITLKAARLLARVPVIAFFAKSGRPGIARGIAEGQLNPAAEVLRFDYPMTTELPSVSAAYRTAMTGFYDRAAAGIAQRLEVGHDVAVLCEGDPFFYGSYAHVHERLAGTHRCEVVPGVMSMSGCWTRAGLPMTCGEDSLTVLSGTMDEDRLAERLAHCEAAVIMKVGGHLPKIRRVVARADMLRRAVYVERGTTSEERIVPLAGKTDDAAPYFSLVLIPSATRRL